MTNVKDNRSPEAIGNMLASLKKAHPEATAVERANMVEEFFGIYKTANMVYTLGNGNGK